MTKSTPKKKTAAKKAPAKKAAAKKPAKKSPAKKAVAKKAAPKKVTELVEASGVDLDAVQEKLEAKLEDFTAAAEKSIDQAVDKIQEEIKKHKKGIVKKFFSWLKK